MNRISELLSMSGNDPEELSRKSEITRDRLRDLVEGAVPTLRELRAISKALNLDYSFFRRPDGPSDTELLFRNTMGSRLTSGAQKLTAEVLSLQLDKSLDLMSDQTGTRWLSDFKVSTQSYSEAEHVAAVFRERYLKYDDVSPLLNLPELAANLLNVILLMAPKLRIDGASALVDGNAFVFIAPRTFVPRMLFTLGHEIGHLIFHHGVFGEFATFDSEESTGRLKPSSKSNERFADAFASCLLLPPTGVGITLKKVRQIFSLKGDEFGDIEILYLAYFYGVSFQVAARRCEDLGILEPGGAVSLYEKVREKFKSPEQRARQLNFPPRPDIRFPTVPPQLLRRAIESVRSGQVSVGRAAANLNVSISSLIRSNAAL